MSLLTLLQNAADRIGIVRPSSVITSTDQQVLRLLGYAQEEGKALAKRHTWQVLTKEQTFTGAATTVQTGAVPANFDRFIDDTFFNRTRKRPVYGPLNAQDWQFNQSVVAATVIESFRQRGDDLLLTPTPTAGDSYAYEYVSKNWCQSSGATAQSAWAADTDTGILPEELIALGVVWRFKAGQGFDYSQEFQNYELQVAQAISRDGGKPTLNAGQVVRTTVRAPFIPEGGWAL